MLNPEEQPSEEVVAVLAQVLPEEWREEPAGWPSVEAWETEHGILLPEPYRTMIARVANGCGLGPPEDGGLLPLGWLPHGWFLTGDRDPAAPFPLEQAWFWETDPAPAGRNSSDLIAAAHLQGSLLLGGEEGGDFWILVTAGPLRGRVWILSEFGACPFSRPGTQELEAGGTGFLDWLTYWSSLDGRPLLEDFAWPCPMEEG